MSGGNHPEGYCSVNCLLIVVLRLELVDLLLRAAVVVLLVVVALLIFVVIRRIGRGSTWALPKKKKLVLLFVLRSFPCFLVRSHDNLCYCSHILVLDWNCLRTVAVNLFQISRNRGFERIHR